MEENKEQQINTKENSKQRKGKTRMVLVLLILLLLAVVSYISYRGNYLKTMEVGQQYVSVMEQNAKYLYATMGVSFVILFFAFYFTTRGIKKGLKKFFDEEKKEMPKLPNKSISFLLGVIGSVAISNILLEKLMLCFNIAWFGMTDPIFHTDISFYIFQKPFIEMAILCFVALVVVLAIYIGVYYIIVFNKYFDGINGETLRKSSFIHQMTSKVMLAVIGFSSLIVVKMQGIGRDSLLTLKDEAETKIFGAGVTDVTIKLWGYRILAIVMIVSVYFAIRAFKNKNSKKTIQSLLAVPAYMIGMFIIMIGFQTLYVGSNELDKQKDYIKNNIKYTQNAYNLQVEEKSIDHSGVISLEETQNNQDLLNNIPVITPEVTLSTLNQTQTSTGYYDYSNIQLAEYNDSLVYVSPREISNNNRTYNNKTYELTHGYGVIISSATSADNNGNIQYLQKDFEGTDQEISIQNPRIYYGLKTENTIVTNKDEFDYPIDGNENATNSYEGEGGLSLNFLDKIILGIHERDLKIAFSNHKDGKILMNRNIIERAKSIMPYFIYDEDPYLVITEEGKLVWVLDAYTVSNQYPYAQSSMIETEGSKQEINYIRNSVKVLIDAYDGTTDFYITDETDPIAMAYRNIYETLFKKGEEIPQDIATHFVYPEFLYNVQAEVLKNYHNVTPDVLYRGDDMWDIATYPTTATATKGSKMSPYYTMVNTVDSDRSELGLVLPYTPFEKQNMNAYLVGTTEGVNNKLRLYRFSSDSNILGPTGLEKQIQADETISKEIESIDVPGTKLTKNMIIVPIENTLLYVEPIYQVSLNEKQNTPILKKVVVASGDKVAIGNNLAVALKNLLSEYAVQVEVENTDTVEGLVQAIIKANNNLKESNNTNNWEQIGKDITKLQDLIQQLETLQKEEEKNKQDNKNETNTIGNTVTNDLNNIIE